MFYGGPDPTVPFNTHAKRPVEGKSVNNLIMNTFYKDVDYPIFKMLKYQVNSSLKKYWLKYLKHLVFLYNN